MTFHPWHHLRDSHPDLTVITRHRLPESVAGLLQGSRVWICATSTQAERRSTLAHELSHVELGIRVCGHDAAGERRVDEHAARRLIALDELIDALRWTRDVWELAEELWVDMPTVRCRLGTLTGDEVAAIAEALT